MLVVTGVRWVGYGVPIRSGEVGYCESSFAGVRFGVPPPLVEEVEALAVEPAVAGRGVVGLEYTVFSV